MGEYRRAMIAGNWKMNGLQEGAEVLAKALADRGRGTRSVDIVICPPATLLARLCEVLADSPVMLGGQDCHPEPHGAFTGDISARMLKDAGCSHVILGHSERRVGHGETDELVRAKASAALASGLRPIICVGETEAQCDAGQGPTVLAAQLRHSIPENAPAASIIIAYEPIWAIGTGRTPGLAEIDRLHRHLRGVLATMLVGGETVPLLYGGSVKPANAREILGRPDVDGALVGGASLKIEEFWAIVEAAPIR